MFTLSVETIALLFVGMALVVIGVAYWNWSGLTQLRQKQVLLESAVLELRGMVVSGPPAPGPVACAVACATPVPFSAPEPEVPVALSPEPEYVDEDEDWVEEEGLVGGTVDLTVGETTEVTAADVTAEPAEPAEATEATVPVTETVQPSSSASVTSTSVGALDNMPLKELRRLGEKRGIVNAQELKKKELLSALRKATAFESEETLEVEEID